jgi:ATP-dependent exoDNAse (exonuclease V) alpha subunit
VHSVIRCSMSSSGVKRDEADRCRLGRAEGDPRDHAVSTQHGVGTSRAVLIYTTYSAEAVQRISENLCRLARDIRDIGFHTADQIAAKLGIEKGRTDPRAGNILRKFDPWNLPTED